MTAQAAGLARAAQRAGRARAAFDARALRERLLIGAAVLACACMLADLLWLGPAFKAWQGARAELHAAEAAATTRQTDAQRIATLAQAEAAQARHDLAQWRQRVREGDASLREHGTDLVGPDRMLPLLEQILAGHARVRVRAMKSLPKTDLLDPAGAPAGPSLYRHGVELTLEGSFPDLLAYLRALEAAPQRLLWGGLDFRVEQHPKAVLTLKLYTLSLDRHWLEI